MICFQADADVRHRIVLAVRKREPAIDFASAADSDLEGMSDQKVLALAAKQGRILITHDRNTMLNHFRARLHRGDSCPGVFLVSQNEPEGPVVEALLMVWAAPEAKEWENQVRYLPSLSRHIFSR